MELSLFFIPTEEFKHIQTKVKDPVVFAKIFADMLRLNTLSMIMEAGSGHIGTSFSCLDILTWLWTQEMKNPNEADLSEADIYFSSKGHDVPALYSLLIGLGKLDESYLHKLRRLHGLPGHPDVATPFIMTNTGPLGMGISKARGMAIANRLSGKTGHIYVLSGDGELQSGQIWESLGPTANSQFAEITVIVDYNKIQSDTWVKDVSDLGKLEQKFRAFGWVAECCDGHDFAALQKALAKLRHVKDRPQVLIADTVKGKGVSVMERGPGEDGLYKFHSGAPSPENYEIGVSELRQRINQQLKGAGLDELTVRQIPMPARPVLRNPEKLIDAYADELTKIGREHENVAVLDADLILDCGLIPFSKEFPERFIECGIAEQDMVSVAGGLALGGKLPIVHSFACFLSTRPNEQIYNNATEETKIIYVGSLAGLLPAAPGHSHQSVRDISALGSIPGLIMLEPTNEQETRLALRWAVEENPKSTYLRLVSIPRVLPYKLPEDYKLQKGWGIKIRDGTNAALVAYGPVMLTEAYKAAIVLQAEGLSVAVYNLPWLNEVHEEWANKELSAFQKIFTIDDHYLKFGQGSLLKGLFGEKVVSWGLTDIPVCGQPQEVLEHHGLDGKSLAGKILNEISK